MKRLRELTPFEVDRLGSLSKVSETLNEAHDLDDLLIRSAGVAVATLDAGRAFLLLYRGGADADVAAVAGSVAETWLDDAMRTTRERVRAVLRTGEAAVWQRPRGSSGTSPAQPSAPRRAMAAPLRVHGETVGALYADNPPDAGPFSDTDVQLLQIIADFTAHAMERLHDFARLLQSEKLAAVGTLTAGLGHELNNPLTSIVGLAQLLGERLPADSEEHDMASRVLREATRCRNLVRGLLALSRGGQAPGTPIYPKELVAGALRLVAPSYREAGVALFYEEGGDCAEINVNPDQFTQVLLNLLTNALQAVGGRSDGRVTVRLGCQHGHMRLTVADNGAGIPPSYVSHVFDPFFTTKPAGEGMGLGLSISRRVVVAHGGTLVARNDPRGGAVFTIELPLPAVSPQPPVTPASTERAQPPAVRENSERASG